MARNKKSKSSRQSADPLTVLLDRHLQQLLICNYSVRTVHMRRLYLGQFVSWCSERGLQYSQDITPAILQSYQRHLYYYRTKAGKPLRFSSQLDRLGGLRCWFRWLRKQKIIDSNPAAELELPHEEQRLPGNVLTASEVETIMNGCDLSTPLGLRDRSILETFYSTAMRRSELIQLQVDAVDWQRGTILIRQGKGRKDRHVPIGERALAWLRKYRDEVRPALSALTNEATLYLSFRGRPLGPENLSFLVREYIARAGIRKSGSCHLFRHSAATLMLEGGADVRVLQSILGHARLTTTQIYTHVSIKHLKDVHTKTHPAKLGRDAGAEPPTDSENA